MSAGSGPAPQRAQRAPDGPQPTLRRMRQFDIRPDRELGQNFLVDSNILGVIGGRAELAPRGRGARDRRRAGRALRVPRASASRTCTWSRSTSACAPRWATRRRRRERDAALGRRDDSSTSRARPRPTKVVANLPYGIAARVLLRTIEELPGVGRGSRWCSARSASASRRRPASASTARRRCSRSSPARCACCARSRAPSSARCRTSTRCSSMLVAARARAAPRRPALRALRRRRRLRAPAQDARALAGAGRRWAPSASSVRAALVELGHPADVRAERLSPAGLRPSRGCSCRQTMARPRPRRLRTSAGAAAARSRPRRSTSACSSGPPRDGRPPRARERDAVDLARRRAHAAAAPTRGASGDEVVCPRALAGPAAREPRGRGARARFARPPAGERRRCN